MKTSEPEHKVKYWYTEESFTSLIARPILICDGEQFEEFQERIETDVIKYHWREVQVWER
jgi:hypothetical protein